MPIDKASLAKLKRFAQVFKDARERNANESDTVMYLIEFFKDVLEYDPLAGEISKEVAIKDRYCDFAVCLGNQVEFLVEAKAAGIKSLVPKHIEQAGNYASHAGIHWVLLTNGIEWQLYHLTFTTGIEHDLVFDLKFLDELDKNPDFVWDVFSVLIKSNIKDGSLKTYFEQKQLLSPKAIVNCLLGEDVLMKIRQELNRKAPARLELKEVFRAVLQVLNSEAVAAAGDISAPNKKRRRRRRRADGEGVEQTVDEGTEDEGDEVDVVAIVTPPSAPGASPKPPASPAAN